MNKGSISSSCRGSSSNSNANNSTKKNNSCWTSTKVIQVQKVNAITSQIPVLIVVLVVVVASISTGSRKYVQAVVVHVQEQQMKVSHLPMETKISV